MKSGDKKWYVVYTRSRWEKKVSLLLLKENIDNYCPLNKVQKKWSDRIKKVEIPLFTSYVFVHISNVEKQKVREVPGVINFIYSEGAPAIVKNEEIEKIRLFLSEYEEVELHKNDVSKDQRVIIGQGLFIDEKGKVKDLINKRARVVIDSLGYTLVASFEKSKLIST
jgi:transcription antitermination factor NusG